MTRDELAQYSFLIVDDDALAQDAMVGALRYIGGKTICCADNCDAALRLARQHQPDFVLLDIYMPVAKGLAMLDKLREMLPDVVMLLLTSSVRPGDFNRALDQRVDGYCTQPVLPTVVLKALRQARHYRHSLQAVPQ